MNTYKVFLDYYDKIIRSTKELLEEEMDFLLNDCIKKYNKNAKTVLEVACGTGIIGRELIKNGFSYTGLDISVDMLEKAGKYIDTENLILGDMTSFNLNKQFDILLCNYNSICHLLKWSDWKNFFSNAYNSLNKNGLFVFDINTLYEFNCITRDFAQFYNISGDTVCMEMFKKEGYFEWLIKMFQKREDGRYDLVEECVKENSFEIEKIKNELIKNGFEILDILDYHFIEITDISERVYFLCKKI